MAYYYYYSVFPPLLVPRLLYHDTLLLLLNKHGVFILSCLLHSPLDLQGKILNFCQPTLLKVRFKITVTPPPPSKNGQSQNYGAFNKL